MNIINVITLKARVFITFSTLRSSIILGPQPCPQILEKGGRNRKQLTLDFYDAELFTAVKSFMVCVINTLTTVLNSKRTSLLIFGVDSIQRLVS
jgi:hypothetical protein